MLRPLTGRKVHLIPVLSLCLAKAYFSSSSKAKPKLEYTDGNFVCPGSPSANPPLSGAKSRNAWTRTVVSVAAPCRDVKAEMIARIGAQSDATWIDPHNAGTYSIIDDERESVLSTQRKTGDGFFTDAISFSFDAGSDTCTVYCTRQPT